MGHLDPPFRKESRSVIGNKIHPPPGLSHDENRSVGLEAEPRFRFDIETLDGEGQGCQIGPRREEMGNYPNGNLRLSREEVDLCRTAKEVGVDGNDGLVGKENRREEGENK